jgi:serine/threonine-protein kinase HipA
MTDPVALVYKKGIPVAKFSKSEKEVTFEYLPDAIGKRETKVATTLPTISTPITLPNGATPTYFAGLLPEGRRLSAIANRLGTSIDNDLDLLLEIGADLIGDVQLLPPGASPDQDRDAVALPRETSQLSFEDLKNSYFGLRATGLPGFQDKVSSKMLNARARMSNVDYILKLNPVEAPFAVENEYFFLKLANECGISTPKFKLLTDKNGEHALLLERFDRIPQRHGKYRLAAEDGCQVLDLYPAQKYSVDFVTMAQKMIDICPAREDAGSKLFKQLVFNWLVGNGDAHSKNFSILEGTNGRWNISPAYDLLCTRFYDDREMALAIEGQKTNWDSKLLLSTAERLRVPQKVAARILDQLLVALSDLPEQILSGALPFPRYLNIEVSNFLRQRRKAIEKGS